jgi:hypothetical protein
MLGKINLLQFKENHAETTMSTSQAGPLATKNKKQKKTKNSIPEP